LSPDIPPPPPLHNTVEAARYHDQLARVETARRDPEMAREAMQTISESLVPIAKAAPPMCGTAKRRQKQILPTLHTGTYQLTTKHNDF